MSQSLACGQDLLEHGSGVPLHPVAPAHVHGSNVMGTGPGVVSALAVDAIDKKPTLKKKTEHPNARERTNFITRSPPL